MLYPNNQVSISRATIITAVSRVHTYNTITKWEITQFPLVDTGESTPHASLIKKCDFQDRVHLEKYTLKTFS